MTQVRRLRAKNRVGNIIGRVGPNGDSGVWSIHDRASDPYYNDVSLLLHMDGTNGSTTFTDLSRFAHTVTANGNAQVSTTQSQFGGASAVFDGNGDYLSVPTNSAFDFGTGDFTVECWVYAASFPIDKFIISASGSGGLFWGFRQVNGMGIGRAGVAWDIENIAHNLPANTWTHTAVCRRSSSVQFFVNGAQVGSTATNTRSYNLSTGSLTVASQGANFYMNANIDELRVTKGIARYRSAFVVPPRAFLP